jgi:hypothetical protein
MGTVKVFSYFIGQSPARENRRRPGEGGESCPGAEQQEFGVIRLE